VSGDTPTGGQLCVRGILQQMLRGLAYGTALVLDHGRFDGNALRSVTLTLEPANGGDHQAETANERVVEQVKIRTNDAAWTSGEIAGEVLPDLLRAVKADALPTRYRFATDGALNCATLIELSQRLQGRPVPTDPLAALDETDAVAFHYSGWKSERAFFAALAKRAGCEDPHKFWRLLANLEVEGNLSQENMIEQIDAFLFDIVDCIEDIPGKRAHLILLMMELAAGGARITVEDLLQRADLPVERALHYAKVPTVTGKALNHDLALLGYQAEHDVREAPRSAGAGLVLIAGESGYGKSWRMAAMLSNLDRAGHLAILVSGATSVDAIRQRVVELVWHSSFDSDQSVPGLARRLGHRFVDADGAWLTVGVDDVQDRELVKAMRAANWAQYGIRVVATVPQLLAEEAKQGPLPPAIIPVERFNLPQLRRFLDSHDRRLRDLPDDVIELLQTPIFADLYRRVGAADWAPVDEYALIDRFWKHTTYQTKGMADYQDDALALERLARTLLGSQGSYPWPVEAAYAADLKQDARQRLVKSGILRQGDSGIVVIHDRVLNWVIARAVAADLRNGAIDAIRAAERLSNLEDAGHVAAGLSYRLGYVLLDFLWLICRTADPDIVAGFIVAWLARPENRSNQRRFIQEHLAGLGAPILPALARLARRSGEKDRINALHAAKAIAMIGNAEKGAADATIIGLLADDSSEQAIRSGLVAAADMPLPDVLQRLWSLHLARREALAAAADKAAVDKKDSDERFQLSDRAQTSFRAIKSAVIAAPAWIEAQLGQTTGELPAILLLELLLEVEHGAGRNIWSASKAAFLARITPGKSILPKAIKHFGDASETERLERASENAEYFEPVQRFDALIRIAPDRAAAGVEVLTPDQLGTFSRFSVRRLVRNGGAGVREALLARHPAGWQGMAELANTYWFDRLAIDTRTFVAMIEALEQRLIELAGKSWEPGRDRSLVQFLAETTRPDLLAILETYRGSNFERLLRDRAMRGDGRNSLCVDTHADHIERLLLMIGGKGFGDAVVNAITRKGTIARRDGYQAAIHLPAGTAAPALSTAAASEERHKQEGYDLTVALAAHGADEALYALVMDTQAAYEDAIDVRRKNGPWCEAVAARMRADLASPDGSTRSGAACALAMAPPEDAGDLLADTLDRCPDDDPSALTVVRISSFLGLYAPTMLPKLRRMLALPAPGIREAVLPYLAEHGDQAAHEAARDALASGAVGEFDRATLRAGYALSEHEPEGGPASNRLLPFVDRHHGIYPIGAIARRLHDNKLLSNDAMIDLAYSAKRVSSDCTFWLIDRIKAFDPEEALAIAERRFAQAASASGARQILELAADGVNHLIRAYLDDQRHEVRWLIARTLRWHGNRALVIERLRQLAGRNSVAARTSAAELLGWIPGPESAALLAALAEDPVTEVSDAALEAETRAETERWGRVLIGELADADHLGRWSRIYALVDLVDPYLLELDNDGLAIGEIVEGFDEIFAIWIEKALVKRKNALTKRGEQLDRRS
jgi:hypothetical protein